MKQLKIWSILVLAVMMMPIKSKAAEDPTNLVIWSKDDSKVAYALSEKPKITFTETDLVVITNETEVNYPLANMARFTYETSGNSAIKNLQNDEVMFHLDGDFLLFPSLKSGSTLSIYSQNGTIVFKKRIQDAGEYSFPLLGLNKGVYLVTVNGLTYKIVKR